MRKSRPNEPRMPLQHTPARYHWKSDRDEGFTEVRFVYDREGRLVGVDYELPAERRRTPAETH